MSFRQIPTRQVRPNRSQLFVLSTDRTAIEAAASSAADVVFFELEDAVAPDRKPEARQNVVEALNDLDWKSKTVSMRINGLDTPHMYRDIVDVLEAPSERLDLVLIPKVGNAADIYAVDMLISQVEQATGRTSPLGLEAMIETAQGIVNISEIAAGSPRLEALHFGENDYATSVGAQMRGFAMPNPDYSILTEADSPEDREKHWGDMWHYVHARVVATARAHGLRPVVVGFGDPDDTDGFISACRRAATLGFEGKWTTDPARVQLVNELFSPSPERVAFARAILEEVASNPGSGVYEVHGKTILMPQVRDARQLIDKAERMGL